MPKKGQPESRDCTQEMANQFGARMGGWIDLPEFSKRKPISDLDEMGTFFNQLSRKLISSTRVHFKTDDLPDFYGIENGPRLLNSLTQIFEHSDGTGLVTDLGQQILNSEGQHAFRFVSEENLVVPINQKIRDRISDTLAHAYYEVGFYLHPRPHKGEKGIYIVPFLTYATRNRVNTIIVDSSKIKRKLSAMMKGRVDESRKIWEAVIERGLRHPFRGGAPE